MFALKFHGRYLQNSDWHQPTLMQRVWIHWRAKLASKIQHNRFRHAHFLRKVHHHTKSLESQTETLEWELKQTRAALRKEGFTVDNVSRAFAIIRQFSQQELGMAHYDHQILGGWTMLNGFLAEMNTGEGKTLTSTLPAATAALAGLSVHIVTVNDYLAERDASEMSVLFNRLGLSTGLVLEDMQEEEKGEQYQRDIVYCTCKSLMFDYLRDRIKAKDCTSSLALASQQIQGISAPLMLRGLHFVLVDEADSVLIDEARTPLVISKEVQSDDLERFYAKAIEIARSLVLDTDFVLDGVEKSPKLTLFGLENVTHQVDVQDALWAGEDHRREIIEKALYAEKKLELDVDYIIRDGKVMIVDENTGRVMPDRSWEQGLHQLVELKENLAMSLPKENMAKLSFQLFFRRYLTLSGMTGTCQEVSEELAKVYGLGVVKIAPRRPSRRKILPTVIYPTVGQKWQAVTESILSILSQQRPILIGTRSIAESQELSECLELAGIEHQVLNAKNDEQEAQIVAKAAQPNRVTIATNMAGRGTDIKLSPEVSERGGLHVILTARHDNARVDRQLMGRCARQGDKGSFQEILSLEDELLRESTSKLTPYFSSLLQRFPKQRFVQTACIWWYRQAQKKAERHHREIRKNTLKTDFNLRDSLSFSGTLE